MVTREVLDTGLRLITESMPHVRSVSIGVWLTRGSRHESRAAKRHRAFRRAHALQGHGDPRSAEDIAQAIDSIGGQLDAFTAKEYASYYIKVLDEHLPMAVDLLSDIVMQPALRRRTIIEQGEEGHPRRDQDGRGHARRSRPRALHAALLGRARARPADSRVQGNGGVLHAGDPARLFQRRPTSRRT